LEKNLNPQSASSLTNFAAALTEFATDVSGDQIVRPRSHLRHWLMRGAETLELGSEFKEAIPAMKNRFAPELAYAFDATLQGPIGFAPVRFQIFPGHESIPYGMV